MSEVIMTDAEGYKKNNSLQKKDTMEFLEDYAKKIKWKPCGRDRIIDIGCADGSVLIDVVMKFYAPDNYGYLLGCDLSQSMVDYARAKYKNSKTDFLVMDITDVPSSMFNNFDHLFSFYTLHWVRSQKTAFQNMFDLLAEGGDILLLFLGFLPAFEVYRKLAKMPKWSSYLQDVEKYISPYHDSLDPQKEVTSLMETVGFKDIEVKVKETSFTFGDMDRFKRALVAVLPFPIPSELHTEFVEDFVVMLEKLNLMLDELVNNNNAGETANVGGKYKVISVYATK